MKPLLASLLCTGFFLSVSGASNQAENFAYQYRDDGSVSVSWTTRQPVPLMRVLIEKNGQLKIFPERESRPRYIRVHEAVIPAEFAGDTTLTIRGRDFQLKRPGHPADAPLKVELSVSDPAAPRKAYPVRSGIPLAQGKIFSASRFALTDAHGVPVEAHFEVFSRWPDDSVKWLAVNFNADTEKGKAARYILTTSDAPQRLLPFKEEPFFRKLQCRITFADNSVAAADVAVLPLLRSVRLPGGREYTFGGAFAGHPEFSLELIVRTAPHGFTFFDWAITSLRAKETSLIRKIEWVGFPRFRGGNFALRQLYDEPERRNGFASDGSFAFYSRDFWQQYPKGIAADNGSFTFEVLPELPARYQPEKLTTLDLFGRYFWYQNGAYTFPANMQIQGEFAIVLGNRAADPALFDQLDHPLFAAAAPEYYCSTGAFGTILPAAPQRFPETDRVYAESFANHLKTRNLNSEYGWMSFGDWFGENIYNWGNNEYDLAYTALIQFARTGNFAYFKRALEMTRHYTSVDLHQTAAPGVERELVYLHTVGHVSRSLRYDDPRIEPGKSPAKAYFGYLHDAHGGHDVMTGSFLAACLTGNRRMLDAANRALLQQARYMTAKLNVYIERTIGWHLVNLTNAYLFTGNPVYLNGARLLVDEVVRLQNPRTGCLDLPIAHGECSCPDAKQHRGGKSFAMGVLLSGLRTYHEITGEERAKRAIILGAKWLLDEAFDYSSGKFRYKTGCPVFAKGYAFESITAEGIAYAGKLSGDPRYAAFLRRYLPQEIRVRRPGTLGKDFAMATRAFPVTLALLENMGVKSFPAQQRKMVKSYTSKPGDLLIPAADFIRQSGGDVRIRFDKESPLEKSLSHWDAKGHSLSWKVTPPKAGNYRIGLIHCGLKPASRRLKIDGRSVANFAFPATGGLGERSEDWHPTLLKIDGKPVELKLDGPPLTLTLSNEDGSSLNLGLLWLEPSR